MMFIQVILFNILMVISISVAAPQSSSLKELAVSELQPPPVTYSETQSNISSLRSKRCGGGGGCHQPAPSKTYHISITVKKAPAPKPKPIMRHPAPVAVVPVAIVPVAYAHPMPTCCSGGGGGGRGGGRGGGGKKWHKGK